jgi:hypothetical protein
MRRRQTRVENAKTHEFFRMLAKPADLAHLLDLLQRTWSP